MSLTSTIIKNKEVKEFFSKIKAPKKYFYTKSERKPFSNEYIERVSYGLEHRFYSILVGTAFDFLARFEIAKFIDNNKSEVYERLIDRSFRSSSINNFYMISFRMASLKCEEINESKILCKEYEEKFKNKNDNSIKAIKKYINNESDNFKEIIDICIYFSKILDTNVGALPKIVSDIDEPFNYFTTHKESITNELTNLLITFKENFIKDIIKKESVVIFNPEFGLGSELIWGAEADIYIDGVLYDLKTTKNKSYAWEDVAQITAYYLLNKFIKRYIKLSETLDEYSSRSDLLYREINKVAFYKARYGEIEYLDTSYFKQYDEEKLMDEFEELLWKLRPSSKERLKKYLNK